MRLVAVLAAFAIVLAGCGNDAGGDAAPPGEQTPQAISETPFQPETSAPTPSATLPAATPVKPTGTVIKSAKSQFGMMLFDEMNGLDYLLSRPEADASRVGVFGLSMGATKAWWLSALDTRITTCLDLCCMTDFDELMKANNLKGHGIYYYVPSLLKHFETKTINELIVPRPHVSLNGRFDDLTPPKGVEKVRDYLLPLYAKAGKMEDCRIELFDCPHEELPEMRQIILGWLDRYLVKS